MGKRPKIMTEDNVIHEFDGDDFYHKKHVHDKEQTKYI